MNWNIESAMKVLEDNNADAKIWAEAVEWLIIYGPPEIKDMLLEASGHAASQSFPQLKPSHYSADGSPCYDLKALAEELKITEEEIRKIIDEKEKNHSGYSIVSGEKITIQ
ncbi:MAG: hypothetical protein OCC45_07455 [Desulfotalea sp.]